MFRSQLDGLSDRYGVIAYDQRGMGGSTITPDGYDKRTMAADIAGKSGIEGIELGAIARRNRLARRGEGQGEKQAGAGKEGAFHLRAGVVRLQAEALGVWMIKNDETNRKTHFFRQRPSNPAFVGSDVVHERHDIAAILEARLGFALGQAFCEVVAEAAGFHVGGPPREFVGGPCGAVPTGPCKGFGVGLPAEDEIGERGRSGLIVRAVEKNVACRGTGPFGSLFVHDRQKM